MNKRVEGKWKVKYRKRERAKIPRHVQRWKIDTDIVKRVPAFKSRLVQLARFENEEREGGARVWQIRIGFDLPRSSAQISMKLDSIALKAFGQIREPISSVTVRSLAVCQTSTRQISTTWFLPFLLSNTIHFPKHSPPSFFLLPFLEEARDERHDAARI